MQEVFDVFGNVLNHLHHYGLYVGVEADSADHEFNGGGLVCNFEVFGCDHAGMDDSVVDCILFDVLVFGKLRLIEGICDQWCV